MNSASASRAPRRHHRGERIALGRGVPVDDSRSVHQQGRPVGRLTSDPSEFVRPALRPVVPVVTLREHERKSRPTLRPDWQLRPGRTAVSLRRGAGLLLDVVAELDGDAVVG